MRHIKKMLQMVSNKGLEIHVVEIEGEIKIMGEYILMKKLCFSTGILLMSILVLSLLTTMSVNAETTTTNATNTTNTAVTTSTTPTGKVVKIGLFYSSSAQEQIELSADQGIAFSSFNTKTSGYTSIFNFTKNESVAIKRDTMLHIKIGASYGDYQSALTAVNTYKGNGVTAYPVFTDTGWQVWSGFFANQGEVDKAIADIKTKTTADCSAVPVSTTRVYVQDKSSQVLFIYASDAGYLRGKSLSTANPAPIKIGKYNYRGEVEFQRRTNSDMTIINVLPMEHYLYGVVPNEIEGSANIEAVKAQAVAARTFAYYSIQSSKHTSVGFDLCDSICCQTYEGYNSEYSISNSAVDVTADMVIKYNGKLIQTPYFASSGGKTEDAVNVWGFDFSYLKSVEDTFESGKSYNYNWTKTFTIDELTQKFASKNIGTVTGIEVTKQSNAGRATEVVVRGTLNTEGIIYRLEGCRTFLSLPSQWYTISTSSDISITTPSQVINTQLNNLSIVSAGGNIVQAGGTEIEVISADGSKQSFSSNPTQYVFTGKGWGHSVGMSQEGAKGMANAGYTFEQVLAHYYQGTTVEQR